ncbi:MAG: phage tail sheath family protein, partial [Burkholderiales bacterium]|nr:phage tail sheath family protein [Burkholderiales bacterium]
MPEYLVPGVYVEEIAAAAKPIEGVPTSTAGFIGAARFGPVDSASPLITSLAEYERLYDPFGAGQPLDWADAGAAPNFQWQAVRAFFAEGGQRLFIARLFRPTAGNDDGVARIAPSRFGGLLDLRARHPGAAGNLSVRIELHPAARTLASRLRSCAASVRTPSFCTLSALIFTVLA